MSFIEGFEKSLNISHDTREFELAIYDLLCQTYEEKGDYKNAYEYRKIFLNTKDTLQKAEAEKTIENLKIAYETDKKEVKISTLEKEKRFITWLAIAGGILAISILMMLIFRYRLTKQKMAWLKQEQQLIATKAVLDGETAERTRLARDLHDGLGGMLSVVKLKFNTMKQGATLEKTDVENFDNALNLLDESISELRRVAHNMMPDSLIRYGLKPALSDFCKSIPNIEFRYYGNDDRLDSKLEIMIYRVVYELVNNIIKHANAQQAIVQIVQEADRIALTVQDNGRGFDTTKETSGMGLKNIRNRVESHKGKMDIWSAPNEGTEISIDFKIVKNA